MISLLFLAPLATAEAAPTFAPVGLDTVNVPRLLFACEANKPETGLFALDLRHDKSGNRVWIGRTFGKGDELFEGQIEAAAMDHNAERMLLKLQAKRPTGESADVILRAGGGTISATFDLGTKDKRYSGFCNNVPAPERG